MVVDFIISGWKAPFLSKVEGMEAKGTRLAQAADWYLAAVDAVPADGCDSPTLCAVWTAPQVVHHVATCAPLVRGRLRRGTRQ